jgi:hypothetical protein
MNTNKRSCSRSLGSFADLFFTVTFQPALPNRRDGKKEGPPALKKAEGQSFGHSPECTGSIDRPKVDVGYKFIVPHFGEKTSEIYKMLGGTVSPSLAGF